jgi:lipopolysaccharide assembly outer membrane protein LptD (OstA)
MHKSFLIQTTILSLIIIIIFFSYKFLLYEKKNNSENLLTETGNNSFEIEDTNRIEDLNYSSSDNNGNTYEIFSKTGIIDKDSIDVLILKKVKAVINIKNSGNVYVYSDFAKYNKSNLNTHFYENVILEFNEHNITSNSIYLNYVQKEIKISDNINYYDNNNKMTADVIEFNLLTKVSKVYMLDKNDKIKGLIKN